jgi:hypothetical protein
VAVEVLAEMFSLPVVTIDLVEEVERGALEPELL